MSQTRQTQTEGRGGRPDLIRAVLPTLFNHGGHEMKCGSCKGAHGSIEEVRRCCAVAPSQRNRPKPARTPVPAALLRESPTAGQLSFILSLFGEIGITAEEYGRDPSRLSKVEASRAIEDLIKRRDTKKEAERNKAREAREEARRTGKPIARDPSIVQDGMYRTSDGTIYKVQYAVHGSGNLYAKKLIEPACFSVSSKDGRHNLGRVGEGKQATLVCSLCGESPKASFEYESGAVSKLRPEDRMTLEEAKAFGALYGTCCVCGRTLTKEESIEAGIGPICAGKGMWGEE
jgi:hypothetical protein